ncbi:FISUMP domain-containing protein [Fibrobacter sp. UWB10]|uniref:FISUMP domain-containing protein n=1 Tax=Fibrobacter sp. UWB10 TaxID=1896201 RepID=UPI002403684E|nr:FISUMP domain-containing protein [Fibrobacter sp. UWB10]SMP49071.1 major paralogous domain-containing protein [Fibrobacter sp. UWB10]
MKCVKGLGFLWVAVLAAFFALSACDDSSSASGDETGTSSSSVETSDLDESSSSVDKKSSGNESTEKDKSSSSVKGSEPAEVSSSSAKETKNSSDSKSSSSVKSGESSSSSKDKSSSSVSSSSSEISVSSSSSKDVMGGPCPKEGLKKKIGDEFAKCVDGVWVVYLPPSSSSVARSSSSRGYEPLPSPLGYNLSYGEYEDTRDGTKYATIEITNKYGPDSVPKITFTVFAQNLKYHEKITLGANEQDDDTKVEMYCYNDSVEYCNDWWGGLYQWAEMMALPYECNSKSCADQIDPDHDGFHQGICPSGWHLITKLEMLAVSYATGGSTYIEDRMSTLASEVSYSISFGYNTSGFSFIAAGYRCFEENGDSFFDNIGGGGYYGFPRETEPVENKSMGGGISKYSTFDAANPKKYGVSVRCVKNY